MKRPLIAVALALALAGCNFDFKPWAPWPDYGACLRSHVETSTQLVATGGSYYPGGFPIGGGMHLVTTSDTVCDEHEYPLGDSPKYRAKYAKYLIDLAEWRKRNPEAD